jgi:hypothetical protein
MDSLDAPEVIIKDLERRLGHIVGKELVLKMLLHRIEFQQQVSQGWNLEPFGV